MLWPKPLKTQPDNLAGFYEKSGKSGSGQILKILYRYTATHDHDKVILLNIYMLLGYKSS